MAMISPVRQVPWKNGLCAGLLIFSMAHCASAQPRTERDIPLPQQSAGVFIGVEKFSHDFSLSNVRFAVNDAIDLAYSLSIERGLLPPNRILLLLAGEPGEGSRERLDTLVKAGAKRETARQADIYTLIQEQSRLVRRGGILVVSIATHGYSLGAEHLLMAEDSILQFHTGVTADKLLQATETGLGGLRLLIVDACRPQIEMRAGAQPDRRSAMPEKLFETLAAHPGYLVFSAASIGQFAQPSARNGLFTGAIVDALHCKGTGPGENQHFADVASVVIDEVAERSDGWQRPELRAGGGFVDFALPSCARRLSFERASTPGPVPSDVLKKLRDAASYAAVGGQDNLEKSFWFYRQAFQSLPDEVLASLNQGLVARARKLEETSQRAEGVRIYEQLLQPLLAQAQTHSN
ncbi:MAG TPA: caspase family protein [Thermoanaerobaculia bacterium]|nr:caspase family protein [Thermoanaerobaculia bacterium]